LTARVMSKLKKKNKIKKSSRVS